MSELRPLHERDFAARCRIAHALVVGDQKSEAEVAELLHVQFYDVPDLVNKGAEMLRWHPNVTTLRAMVLDHTPREDVKWTPAQLRMMEANRIKFRDAVLKKWGKE